jgi:cystathionine beta-lyase/cystathionine gamma-synthase
MAALARTQDVTTIADNSWATPLLQRPLDLGVDLVVHSASKYLAGHSDLVAGMVAGSAEHIARIDDLTYPYLGARLSPLDAWLLLRGLRTLALRIPRHQTSALWLARQLAAHPAVAAVHHPALAADHGMGGTSGLFSIELVPAIDIPRFCNALSLFRLGVSWGGYESLAFPALIGLRQPAGANALHAFGISDRLVRLSIGLEAPGDLLRDLDQALAAGSPGG